MNIKVKICVIILHIIAFLFDVFLFPIHFLIQRPIITKRKSDRNRVNIKNRARGRLIITSYDGPQNLHNEILSNEITTLALLLEYFCRKYSSRKCLGTREVLEEEVITQPDEKKFVKYVLGDYIWKTYSQVNILSANFGKGIRDLGIEPLERVAIFSETRSEWMIAVQGLFKQSIAVVTVYPNLGEEGIVHALNETEVTLLIISSELLHKLKSIKSKLIYVNKIIFIEEQIAETDPQLLKGLHIPCVAFSEILRIGAISVQEVRMPDPTDEAIIMYTSGTTGTPKGVVLLHSNIMGTVKGFCDCMHSFKITNRDIHIGYLPLAHVFELSVEFVCFGIGIGIGYSNTLTIIDSSSKLKKGVKGDATILKPTIMTVVPLILERISKGILDKVEKAGLVSQVIFKFAYQYKKFWKYYYFQTPLINFLVFNKIAKTLGGNLRIIISGGAPLSVETQEMIEICIGAKLIQGYGLTETAACATVMDSQDMSLACVGHPTTVTAIQIVDWIEQGYSIYNLPYPRGEIIIGGESVSPGYFKLHDTTIQSFFSDCKDIRWFKTGDIAEVHENGVIKIIDRKKDLIKLQGGEYISLGKIETELKTNGIIDNICMIAHPDQNYCVALIIPNQAQLKSVAKPLKKDLNFKEMCDDVDITNAFLDIVQKAGKRGKLEKFEIPQAIKLCSELWTPDNGLVTAAFKLRRRELHLYYKNDISLLYNLQHT